MPHRYISTIDDLHDLTRFLAKLKMPLTVEWRQGMDQSLDQNRTIWMWANEVAYQAGDRTPDEVQRTWKIDYGVPILREDSADFRDLYDRMIEPLPYEMQLEAMRIIPVTRKMTVRQMIRFMDTVQREMLQAGFRLTDPDPMLAGYHARYRGKE